MHTLIRRLVKTVKDFNNIAEIDIIARRYFALNSFEGVLTALGIILASYFAGIHSNQLLIISCLGAAIAIAISGFYGAYTTEKSERAGKLKSLEKSLGINLKKTRFEDAHKFAILVLAFIEGFSPFFLTLLMIIPFFVFTNGLAYYVSFAIAMVLLFGLGIFLGKVSKNSLIASGIKMLFAGAICAIMLYGVSKIFGV